MHRVTLEPRTPMATRITILIIMIHTTLVAPPCKVPQRVAQRYKQAVVTLKQITTNIL